VLCGKLSPLSSGFASGQLDETLCVRRVLELVWGSLGLGFPAGSLEALADSG